MRVKISRKEGKHVEEAKEGANKNTKNKFRNAMLLVGTSLSLTLGACGEDKVQDQQANAVQSSSETIVVDCENGKAPEPARIEYKGKDGAKRIENLNFICNKYPEETTDGNDYGDGVTDDSGYGNGSTEDNDYGGDTTEDSGGSTTDDTSQDQTTGETLDFFGTFATGETFEPVTGITMKFIGVDASGNAVLAVSGPNGEVWKPIDDYFNVVTGNGEYSFKATQEGDRLTLWRRTPTTDATEFSLSNSEATLSAGQGVTDGEYSLRVSDVVDNEVGGRDIIVELYQNGSLVNTFSINGRASIGPFKVNPIFMDGIAALTVEADGSISKMGFGQNNAIDVAESQQKNLSGESVTSTTREYFEVVDGELVRVLEVEFSQPISTVDLARNVVSFEIDGVEYAVRETAPGEITVATLLGNGVLGLGDVLSVTYPTESTSESLGLMNQGVEQSIFGANRVDVGIDLNNDGAFDDRRTVSEGEELVYATPETEVVIGATNADLLNNLAQITVTQNEQTIQQGMIWNGYYVEILPDGRLRFTKI